MSTEDVSYKLYRGVVQSVTGDVVSVKIPALLGGQVVRFESSISSSASPGLLGMLAVSHDRTDVHWITAL
jgi:hypothetical protein